MIYYLSNQVNLHNYRWQLEVEMSKYRAALIGCGGKGKDHANTLSKHHLVDLVAACDLRSSVLEDFQHNYQIPAIYTDYHHML